MHSVGGYLICTWGTGIGFGALLPSAVPDEDVDQATKQAHLAHDRNSTINT